MKKGQKCWLLVLGALGLCCVMAWGLRDRWLPWIATSLTVSDPLEHASAVLILPGSEEIRPFVAASLIKAGYADYALVPETRANPDVLAGTSLSTAELTRQILIHRGIPAGRIVILKGSSDSTFNDAQALRRHLESAREMDVIVVTSAYHSRRARWTFDRVLPEFSHRLRFYAAPNGFDTNRWWTSRKGRQAVLSERIKLLYYFARHGLGWFWGVILTMTVGMYFFWRRRKNCRRANTGPTEGFSHVGVIPSTGADAGG